MSWQKQAAAVGSAGLFPCEEALGALCCEQFQLMPNPLAGVKKEDMFMVGSALFSYSTMSIWSKQGKNLILLYVH